MRRSPKVSEVLPLLYLHGLSSGDFLPALTEFFGTEAGLSAATITRLTQRWQSERESWEAIEKALLSGDGRARLDGTKELVALQDDYRESTERWAEFLRDLKKRGMRAPVLAVGDGALGFSGLR
jgi:putative transposase